MARKIQQYRGLERNLPNLAEGQIGFTTDTKRIFIGSSSGNVELTTSDKINEIKLQLDNHTYGGKFEWRYNPTTNSLDLVVLE